MEYDDLDDATRVRMGPVGEETPLQMSTLFVCEGDEFCRPDSVNVTLDLIPARLCSDADRDWFTPDSTLFDCRDDAARVVLPSGTEIPVPDPIFLGERVADFLVETVFFNVSYEDLGKVADSGDDPRFRLSGGEVLIHPGLRINLRALLARVEEEANADATPWDGKVSADYDAEADSTYVLADLSSAESFSDGMGVTRLTGRCPGRGWCQPDRLTLRMSVEDSSLFAQNLSEVSFVLDRSQVWQAPYVTVERLNSFGSIQVRMGAGDLKRLSESSTVEYRADSLTDTLTRTQLSTLRRFAERIAEIAPSP